MEMSMPKKIYSTIECFVKLRITILMLLRLAPCSKLLKYQKIIKLLASVRKLSKIKKENQLLLIKLCCMTKIQKPCLMMIRDNSITTTWRKDKLFEVM